MFQFSHHSAFYLLLLLPICIVVFIWYQKWRRTQLKKLGDEALVQNMIVGPSAKWKKTQFLFLLIGLFLLIVSLADPKSSGAQQSMQTSSKEIVIALDLSNSMLATDVAPSRLDKAKQLINQLIDTNTQDKFGLVVFAGNAYIATPITIDIESIKMNVATMQPNILPSQGTNISEAIIRAHDCFNTKREGGKAILLITDGEDHEQGIDNAINTAVKDDIAIITVGVGSSEGGKIIDTETQQPKLDENGQQILSKLNEAELTAIAKKGNGEYIPLQNMQTSCNQIHAQFNQLASGQVSAENTTVYSHYFQWLLLPSILLIALSFFYNPQNKS
jgi:Ca-activated chloride channel homolog